MSDVEKQAEKVLGIASQTLWAQKLYNEAMRDLIIFGTTHPHIYKKPTLWQRIKWPARDFFRRCRDACLVLIGRAEISDPYDD
jgi:hypothetical protein